MNNPGYRIFDHMDIVDKYIAKLMRPDQKTKDILNKFSYMELDESVIINAVNETLFSYKPMDAENTGNIIDLELVLHGVHQYVKSH